MPPSRDNHIYNQHTIYKELFVHALASEGIEDGCESCYGEPFCLSCDGLIYELAYECEVEAMDMYDNYHARRPASKFARCECGRPDTKADILKSWKR